ncbi:MAG: mechanosensitive ion channel protein MscS [Candidatus Altiarchaeales archaeon WOR_SM1_86-2]|nr:MAG: mechanosensitive ion channel protein MscS [Candidatus Altiarchaeales archaeon WOR_SM1_86-2]ODS40739.1 MAG: mechanosensitive ion channel protein MscS [Candidatus Altiarchaeales archaeon WOR_SM1_79]
MKKIINLSALITISALLWFAGLQYQNTYLEKGSQTFLTLAFIYFLFSILLEGAVNKQVKNAKSRYHLKKAVSIIHILIIIIALITIWVENPQALLVAYGIVAAGLAIALQDIFKNLGGGIIIFLAGIYRVGDRIEINSKYGDVIDIGIFYTTLLELREWISGDQATGRLTIIPNGYVLSGTINNYTRDNAFIWDEINIPITYDSDWKDAAAKILDIVREETRDITKDAEKEIAMIEKRYYLPERAVEPSIFLKMTDNWIDFSIRYLTETRERRALHNRLSKILLDEIQKSENIKIASETLDVSLKQS